MTKSTMMNITKVSTIYAGTIMGAGFASGQELTQFFVVYGNMGLAGLFVTSCLFSWLGILILEISFKIKATSYHQLLYYVCGKRIGLLLDLIITLSLFGVLTIMLAGSGTIFKSAFNLPYVLGLSIMSVSLILTTFYGMQGITTANIIITPLLTITILIIGFYSLAYHEFRLPAIPPQAIDLPAPHWLLASLLYLSYNLVMSTAVLVPLSSSITKPLERIGGSIGGGLLLMLLAGLIIFVVMIHYPQTLDYEIPMLYIASSQHYLHHTSYVFIFIAAMYTTGLASLYGSATKLTAVSKLSMKSSLLLLLSLSLFFSYIGFADLIAIIFPLFGYGTLWFTYRLLYLSFLAR